MPRLLLVAALVASLMAGARPCAAADRVLWQWSAPGGMAAWEANAEVKGLRDGDAAMEFRTVGSDPILSLRERLDVTTSPWQALEVELAADRAGDVVIFWTGTDKGAYGGFSQDKTATFVVKGDGAMRTYRSYPFWTGEGRITKLRFDPYPDATFRVRAIRLVQVGPPTSQGTVVHPGRPGAFAILDGITASNRVDAALLRMEYGTGMALAAVEPINCETTGYVSVRLRSTRVRRASILFATDDSTGLGELGFPVEPDGKWHTVNVDMLGSSGWKGRAVVLGIRPGSAGGDSLEVGDLRPSAQPRGPAEIRILSLGIAEALPRVGELLTISARIANTGGTPVAIKAIHLGLPGGAAVVSGPVGAGTDPIRFGQEQTVTWRVRFKLAGLVKPTVSCLPATGPAVTASCVETITPRPRVARSSTIPAPVPVKPVMDVGIYYFPGWRGPSSWSPITRFPERRPVLGWYREGEPSVADWQVKWAVEHGVTFFAYDWYWSQGSRSLEHALHDGLFKARFGNRIKFCLLWANHNGEKTSSHDDMLAVNRYWLAHYFRRPDYYTIDGKPVVIIFTPYRFRADMGSAAVRRSFDAIRAECRVAGLKGIYLIACVGGSVTESAVAAAEGYDAITAYNWPGLNMKAGEKWAPYADLLAPHRQLWEEYAKVSPIPIMTPVSAGWDSRPWHGDSAMVRNDRTPALFQKHLQDARTFIETHPRKALRVALVEAWNELGEGSYVEPHKQYGFGYLDAIRSVFTKAPTSHTDIKPEDVGLSVPQVDMGALARGSWDFRSSLLGWESVMDMETPRQQGGALTSRSIGRDPAFFGPPTQLPASDFRVVKIQIRLSDPSGSFRDSAQLFWGTRSSGTSESASEKADVVADGKWREIIFRVGENVRWRGIITSLRLDPCSRAGVTVQVRKVTIAP